MQSMALFGFSFKFSGHTEVEGKPRVSSNVQFSSSNDYQKPGKAYIIRTADSIERSLEDVN